MTRVILLCTLLLLAVTAVAQKNITGTVRDASGKAIPGASVSLMRLSSGASIRFAQTDKKGVYVLTVADTLNPGSFAVKVNAPGFGKSVTPLTAIPQEVNVTLLPEAKTLPNVVVKKNRPYIIVKGDTINYSVADFANKNDRVIGDVLKKIPGIEVGEDGIIKYNGKAISNFFIDGDNLLDDKYNLASSTIPADMVDKVQVLENNQPIKVLSGITSTDRAALNITLKDKAKLKTTNKANLGGGIANVYTGELNNLAFKNQFKAINTLKANNIGVDPLNDNTALNLAELLQRADNQDIPDQLNTGAVGPPSISRRRFLFNNAIMPNLNNLFKTKKGTIYRINTYYYADRQTEAYNSNTTNFLRNDTLLFSEIQNNRNRIRRFNIDLLVNINKARYFFNNKLSVSTLSSNQSSDLVTNALPITQRLTRQTFQLTNDFQAIIALKNKRVLELTSYSSLVRNPGSLSITPGLHNAIVNNRNPYTSLTQQASVPGFITNNALSYKTVNGRFSQSYKAGMLFQSRALLSTLYVYQPDGTVAVPSDQFINDLNWNKLKVYTESEFQWEFNRQTFSVSLPASLNLIQTHDMRQQEKQQLNRFFVMPALRWTKKIGKENRLTVSYQYNNRLGTIADIYQGTILSNYRSFNSNDVPLPQNNVHSIGMGFNLRKTIKIFFANILLTHSFSNTNNIMSGILENNVSKRIALPFDNNTTNTQLFANASKYLFALKTTVNLRFSYQRMLNNQIQNNDLMPVINRFVQYGFGTNTKVNNWLFINQEFSINRALTFQKNQPRSAQTDQSTLNLKEKIDLDLFLSSALTIKFKQEIYGLRRAAQPFSSFFFSDVVVAFRPAKKAYSFELEGINLGNTRFYELFAVNANSIMQNAYRLQPRMALAKVLFTF